MKVVKESADAVSGEMAELESQQQEHKKENKNVLK